MLKIANHCHYHKLYARELIERIQALAITPQILIHIDDEQIKLCSELNGQNACSEHSFSDPKLIRRASQKNQALIKACNNKKRQLKTVWDLTAGWGKDSFILATQGQQVRMLEQNPFIACVLEYLLNIVRKENPSEILQRLDIQNSNSTAFLQNSDTTADCLYLDPMFPQHKSAARPSKELQLLQLLTDNLDIDQLFELALNKARHRVVVKRPRHAPALSDRKPDIVYQEKTIRFDVYLTHSQQ